MSRPPFLDPPPGVRAYALRTRRGSFAVLDAEPRGPVGTALLVPGYTGSKEDFIALLEPLADAGFRAVAVDGRGQYQSPRGGGRHAYRLGELAEDVLAQAEALPPGGPLHLVGHSLGGLIARGAVLRATARRRTPFASLTLIGSGPGRIARGSRWRVRALVAGLPVLGPRAMWRLWHPVRDPGITGTFLRRRWLANEPAQVLVTGRTLRHEPDRVAWLADAGLPVHVLSGERDGAWPLPQQDRMARRLGAHRTVIKGAEHSPNAEQPLPTAAALADFWTGLRPATEAPETPEAPETTEAGSVTR
ncbi:alpha/beta fold hydrolase [Streptomyces sp. B6B3]|uniref:alpha/beta fold hydrolase n=1 Tax=Streptomyces sp. B6B3 TaxID=3153570 RepID=UPI00325C554B